MGPESEEKVCKESNRLCGIVMLKLFPEKLCFAGYCCANCSVKFGQSNVNRSRRCAAISQRCQQKYVRLLSVMTQFLHFCIRAILVIVSTDFPHNPAC
jgi:hypothetical protein